MKGPPRRPGADDGRFPVRVRECLAGRGYGLLHLGLLRLGYLGRGDDGRSGVALGVHDADEAAVVREMLDVDAAAAGGPESPLSSSPNGLPPSSIIVWKPKPQTAGRAAMAATVFMLVRFFALDIAARGDPKKTHKLRLKKVGIVQHVCKYLYIIHI